MKEEEQSQKRQRQYELYLREYDRNEAQFSPMIEHFGKGATEYAQLIYRQLFLLNGGALVLVPTLLTSVDKLTPSVLSCATTFFVIGLITVLLSAYSTHLNFVYISGVLITQNTERAGRLARVYLAEEHQDKDQSNANGKRITVTFWLSHILGLISVASLICGSSAILKGLN